MLLHRIQKHTIRNGAGRKPSAWDVRAVVHPGGVDSFHFEGSVANVIMKLIQGGITEGARSAREMLAECAPALQLLRTSHVKQ